MKWLMNNIWVALGTFMLLYFIFAAMGSELAVILALGASSIFVPITLTIYNIIHLMKS